jgi:hypothetical protein
MTYTEKVQATRVQVSKCARHVGRQRERLLVLQEGQSDTWLAQRLLTASEHALHENRERLKDLLNR